MSDDGVVRLTNYGAVVARVAFLILLCLVSVFMVPAAWERGGSALIFGAVPVIAAMGMLVLLYLTAVRVTVGPRVQVRTLTASHDLEWAQVRSLSVRTVSTKASVVTLAEHMMLCVETERGSWELKTSLPALKRLREVMRAHGQEQKLSDGIGGA